MRLLTVVLILGAIVAVILIRPRVQEYSRTLESYTGKLNHYITLAEELQGLLEVSTQDIKRIQQSWESSQKEIEALHKIIADQSAAIGELTQIEIPPASEVTPEDFEECLQELQRSRERADELVAIIYSQDAEKMAVISSQGIIIESQAEIIDRQADYIEEFSVLLEQYRKRANRRAALGIAIGVVVGLLL